MAIEQSRKGISEIEGHVAREATSESGTRASFQNVRKSSRRSGELPLLHQYRPPGVVLIRCFEVYDVEMILGALVVYAHNPAIDAAP